MTTYWLTATSSDGTVVTGSVKAENETNAMLLMDLPEGHWTFEMEYMVPRLSVRVAAAIRSLFRRDATSAQAKA